MNRTLLRAALPLLAAAALAACGHDPDAGKDRPLLPTEQFPLKAEASPDVIQLAAHDQGLSPAQGAALEAFAGRWRERGGGVVRIKLPVKAVDQRAAYVTGEAVASRLAALGVPGDRIERVGYEPEGAGPAPVLVAFTAYEADVPACGKNWENLSNTRRNRPMSNFGCAISANMAAQIANPRDIVTPRAEDPTDAQRRSVVLGKYRQGETTSSAVDSQASGSTSSSGSGGSS